MNICAICKTPAVQCCAGCRFVFYCGRDHQKRHWKEGHKSDCRPFRVEVREPFGRSLVATRDIRQGEKILSEKPVVVGPKILSRPICLGCHRHILVNPDDLFRCHDCGWPMCGPQCENSLHHKDECEIMKENSFRCSYNYDKNEKFISYAVIAPLRCLLVKNRSEQKFEQIMNLESHLSDKLKHPLYRILRTNLVPFVRDTLRMGFEETDILQVAAILDTNSFEIRNHDGSIRIRGLFPTAAMANHDCRPNTNHAFLDDDHHTIVFTATRPISRGDLISTTYTRTLWGTLDRRKHLKEAKNFDCSCERCSDPTELNTYLGSIFCSRCKVEDDDSSPKMVSGDPLAEAPTWQCERCGRTVPQKQIVWGNTAIKQEIERMDKSGPLNLERFLHKYKETLHPKNYHAVAVKYALTQLYGNKPGYTLSEMPDDVLERKIDLCREVLEIADILEPGWSRFRGMLLYELHAALVVQTKKEFNQEKITLTKAQETMQECAALLKESAEILQSEPNMKDFLQSKLEKLSEELSL